MDYSVIYWLMAIVCRGGMLFGYNSGVIGGALTFGSFLRDFQCALERAICGLGIGDSATVIPIYLSEMNAKNMRARAGSCYQFTFPVGILVSYWVDYGMQFRTPTAAQWQISLALQHFPGALMGLGMLTLDGSLRWPLCQGN
ncbi:uncharacterized protein BDW43DRAFT_310247 [Aspergillus alliaceus]|uniref:uncharacterized protein n=1 Tax=Petromyces alliaceus TaxID=209559 RepID=UPI0012A5610B|nr:uncharacterized protein BDW43DRAFT_310247 [Aspergillus alliaceus]KAB8234585.1 hypothetical protein BDW43DRAFT_310247 [Aspergillus alliaceus]